MPAAKKAKILKLNDEEKSKADVPRGNKLTPKLQDSISAIDPNVQTNVSAAPPAGHQLLQHFSEEQIALVLSILKSKPDEISIEDYLNEFRESIKLEESRSNRIVDSGEFWKRQFESRCILTDELQTRIASLEKRLQRCRVPSMTSSSEDSEEEKIPSIAQRSTESHKDQPLKPARKKKRKRYESLDTVPNEDDKMGTDALALAYNHDHMMVATYLYRINQIRRSLHAESASASCRKLIELSWKAISDCVPKYIDVSVTNYHTKDIKCLAHLMSEIVECYKSCVEVSTEHYKTIAGRELVRKSNIIHSLCSFFDKTLSELDKLSIAKTKIPIRSGDSTSDRVETSADNDDSMMVRFVANLLFRILGKIAWQQNNDLHKQIFEGILAFIIDHTGILISKIIFREHVAASKLPGNISTGESSFDLTKKECALKSKYLIRLLEMALKIHEKNIGTGPTEELLQKAKRKIQNTLKNSIIGGSLLGLKKPDQIAEEPIDIPGLEGLEMYSEDWAIQCVFTMIEIDENEDDEGVRVGGSGEAVTY
ncbi:uncharacterized protein EAF02_006528 [Botrytis sinoallii]|uniref:uncharacterized protein n=1 Tax=Botrytis sinoallii TaxID=1463999 RepID=UPI0019004566|nr:uncharacterized protein EAF02_006528 [Botrytis sinoallii]KAF7881840.1 hypothetical protein EAF02_006528 [Botrytis sinoallii]